MFSSLYIPLLGIFEQECGKDISGVVFEDLDAAAEMVPFDIRFCERYRAVIDVY